MKQAKDTMLKNNFIPSDKEISISEFKEKFGSNKYPKPIFKVEL